MHPDLYTAICRRIAEQLPEVKWIDRYAQQPQRRDEMYSYDLPAVFIEEERTDWDTLTEGEQHGTVSVRIYVEQRNAADTYYTNRGLEEVSPADLLEAGLERDRLLIRLHEALQGLEGEIFTPLTRRREEPDASPDTTFEDMMVYETRIYQRGYQYEYVEAEPVVSTEKEPPLE